MTRVYVISCHPLFGRGVQALLDLEQGMELLGCETDVDRAIKRIRETCPDVIIVEAGLTEGHLDPVLVRLLGENLGIKIIGLNLTDNAMRIYQGEHRIIRQVQDFVVAVRSRQSALED